jgi:DNA-directed RNA polymerase specialized sigma subunit
MRTIENQVALDIKNYHATGKLPQAWDETKVTKGTGSDYWDWVYIRNGGIEPQELRQDELGEADGSRLYSSNKFRQRAAEWLHENGPEIFTVREMLAYSLCFVDGKTEREAGAEMGVSQPRIFELKASIREKIKKFLGPILSNDLGTALL